MSEYVKLLNWNHNFNQYLDHLLDKAQNKINVNSSTGGFSVIDKKDIVSLEIFKKLDDLLKARNITIIRAIIRQTSPSQFTDIHTDTARVLDGGPLSDLECSLNIPLLNTESALTHWYDFSNSSLKHYDLRHGKDMSRLITMFPLWELEQHKVFTITMAQPMLIRTSIPHNVDARNSHVGRFILSLHLGTIDPKGLLSWDQADIIKTIEL